MTKNSFKTLLRDTCGCAPVPVLAIEGIISLIISLVLNKAALSAGISFESLLKVLILFLVTLGIIHYLLVILEKLRRKEAGLEDIQAGNTREALKYLNSARAALDRLIQSGSDVTELRALRNKLTDIIFELQNPNLEKFKKSGATVDEFNSAEKALLDRAEKLALELQRQSREGTDLASISQLVDASEEAVHNRVVVTDELKDLYMKSIDEQHEKMSKEVASDLNLYLNALQTKYASNRPEVLHTGDYLPYAKWEYSAGERSVTARLSEGFTTHLLIEVRWQDKDEHLVEQVQKEAMSVKKSTYKCLCLVNTAWDKESRDFAARFNYPKLALYLYELNGGLIFNKENDAAKRYEFWFSTEQKREALNERALGFVESREYFTAQEAANELGLNVQGAGKLLSQLEKSGAIVDVSLKSDKIKRYTKAKAEGR